MQLPSPFSTPALPRPSFLQTAVSAQPLSTHAFGPGLPQSSSTAGSKPTNQANYVPRGPNQSFRLRFRAFQPNYLDRSVYPFSCDRCDRSYKSRQQLDDHIAEHVACGLDGCKFVAHPKIVYRHIQMQHETGLASKIMALNTPEEIAKWREERKKKFPTAENVANKEAERQEKMQRGELLEKPDHRLKRNGRNGPSRGRGRGRGGRQFNQRGENETQEVSRPMAVKAATPAKVFTTNAAPVPVIPKLVNEEKEEGEIDDDDMEEKPKDSTLPQSSSSALLSLMGNYASDSEDNDEEPKPAAPSAVAEPARTQEPERKAEAPESEMKLESRSVRKRSRKRKAKSTSEQKPTKVMRPQIRPKRLTLLQKLLQGEILHERNAILQCVHYIVQQKFFGVGS